MIHGGENVDNFNSKEFSPFKQIKPVMSIQCTTEKQPGNIRRSTI